MVEKMDEKLLGSYEFFMEVLKMRNNPRCIPILFSPASQRDIPVLTHCILNGASLRGFVSGGWESQSVIKVHTAALRTRHHRPIH